MAGEILLRMAIMEQKRVPEPGVRKAMHTLRRDLVELTSNAEGGVSDAREDKSIPITERSLWTYLTNFRTVCHLWSAHRILEHTVPFYSIPDALLDATTLEVFLGHATWFLDFAARYTARNSKDDAFLDPAFSWTSNATAVEPPLGELTSSMLLSLENYRASKP